MMARGCHGEYKMLKSKYWIEELGETWLRRRKPTKGCSAK
jgi:hypothetical protein